MQVMPLRAEIAALGGEVGVRILFNPTPVTYSGTSAMVIREQDSLSGARICRISVIGEGQHHRDGHLALHEAENPHSSAVIRARLVDALTVHEAAHCFDPLLIDIGTRAYLSAEAFADGVMTIWAISTGDRPFVAAMADFREAHPQSATHSSAVLMRELLAVEPDELDASYQAVTGVRLGDGGLKGHLAYIAELRSHHEWASLFGDDARSGK